MFIDGVQCCNGYSCVPASATAGYCIEATEGLGYGSTCAAGGSQCLKNGQNGVACCEGSVCTPFGNGYGYCIAAP